MQNLTHRNDFRKQVTTTPTGPVVQLTTGHSTIIITHEIILLIVICCDYIAMMTKLLIILTDRPEKKSYATMVQVKHQVMLFTIIIRMIG
jgi:hypothetical protein